MHLELEPGEDTVGIYVENMRVRIENASFGYDLTFEISISEGSVPATGGPSDSQIMSPGGECFAPLFELSFR